MPGSQTLPGGATSSDYIPGVGVGNGGIYGKPQSPGGNGAIVLTFTSTTASTSTSSSFLPSSHDDDYYYYYYYYAPSTIAHTSSPSAAPSTIAPTSSPSAAPSTTAPTSSPSESPSTVAPTSSASEAPSVLPSIEPTEMPSVIPSVAPIIEPSTSPSFIPSMIPSSLPTPSPSLLPTVLPSIEPTEMSTTTCPDDLTFYCSCQKIFPKAEEQEQEHVILEDSPVSIDVHQAESRDTVLSSLSSEINCQFFIIMAAVGFAAGTGITLMMILLYFCTRASKEKYMYYKEKLSKFTRHYGT